ncbi:MAG: hypothetical protein PHD05_00185 [Sphaerochaetaceae bacterium]|jgi:uncharacterized membrane protein|nr:hypothetical protein [Sphaerochaetaceae bacterium]
MKNNILAVAILYILSIGAIIISTYMTDNNIRKISIRKLCTAIIAIIYIIVLFGIILMVNIHIETFSRMDLFLINGVFHLETFVLLILLMLNWHRD